MSKLYLLDTHCLLWFQGDYSNIPKRVMTEMQNTDNVLLFSQVSLFEIAIKQKIGKLPELTASLNEIYQQALNDDFSYLPIHNQHIFNYDKIPLIPEHRDPFDRLLLATAYSENAVLLSADTNFKFSDEWVNVFW